MNRLTHLTFTLTREPVTASEQRRFAADLAKLGWDGTVWAILNGTVATSTRYTVPKVLRAFHARQLVGVAYILQCREGMKAFFAEPLATLVDPVGIPQFVWCRNAVMVDQYTNPGFVVAGLDRAGFVEQALAFLQRCYLFGVVMEDRDAHAAGTFRASPLMDWGIMPIAAPTLLDEYFAQHSHLQRKLNKFRNKGGTVATIRGPLPVALHAPFAHCLDQAEKNSMGRIPHQDNYINMARQAWCLDSPQVVHFVAYLGATVVGYHSFAITGKQLCCLSGGFDRTLSTTYHAYENLIVESLRFCLTEGFMRIDYGPIINQTKAKMMLAYSQSELRFYTRFAPLRWLFPTIIRNSFWRPALLQPYINIAAQAESRPPTML